MQINKLIIIAEKPRVIIRSLKKGIVSTVSRLPVLTALRASILLKKINSKKAILQMKVNLEKKEITFIK